MKENILVVDDDHSARQGLQWLLEDKGYLIHLADSGVQALTLLSEKTCDVVISDVVMDDMSGLELFKQVQKKAPHTPFLLVTAFASFDTAIEALRLGAFDYLQKPVNHKELLLKIGKALEVARLRQDKEEAERKKDELLKELQFWNDNLERLVEARTETIRQSQAVLKEKEKKLKQQAKHLEEVNTALKVLLEHREHERKELEKNILTNVRELIFPYMEKLERGRLDEAHKMHLGIIRANLEDLISPFVNTLSSKYVDLTPTEIQIADLVKLGKTSKEIAGVLNISANAVSFHRNNIRKKLGLSNKRVNLISYLQSLSQ